MPANANHKLLVAFLRSRHGNRWKLWDFCLGLTAFCVAFLLTPYHRDRLPQSYYLLIVGGVYGIILAVASRFCAVPDPEQRHSRYELIASASLAVMLTYLIFSLIVALVLVRTYGRYIVSITTGFSWVGLIVPRAIMMAVLRLQPLDVVIYGAGGNGKAVLERLRESPLFNPVGFLDNNPELHGKERYGLPVLGSVQSCGAERLKELGTDIVVISIVARKLIETNATALLRLPLNGIEVLNTGAFIETYFKEVSVEYGCPQWFASSASLPANPSVFVVKRILDLGASIVGLLLSLPFWPFIALAIAINSRGPILFRQTRVGLHGHPFRIFKFRTMRVDAEKDGPQWAAEKDPRVTRIGAFLRTTRIDEIPQLINVIKGEMTLVGPRPERPEFVAELARELPYYEHRHLVPPGLTGWAQVRYRYGASKEDALQKLQYDLYYVRHLSLMFDAEILLRTSPLVMKGSR